MKAALLLVVTAGCFDFSPPPPERPAPAVRKLADAQILDMWVQRDKGRTLCPGMSGKMYVKAKVQWPGSRPVDRNIGRDVDSLQPTDFQISGPLVSGTAEAHLLASGDMLASANVGFEVDIVYKPIPKFRFHELWTPEYSCFHGVSDNGGQGQGGNDGGYGGDADLGQPGGDGGNATPGLSGGHGGRVTAYVTYVTTKFHPKLIAVIANDAFYLAPPDAELWFTARGGQGGPGGSGGNGGRGGDQSTETRTVTDDNGDESSVIFGTGPAGHGGHGGNGASGGNGGDGGVVDVVYDSRFPDLRDHLRADASGGDVGPPGNAGGGGAGGGTNAERDPQSGEGGANGQPGVNEARGGRDGRARVRPGAVQSMFARTGLAFQGGRR